MTTKPIPSATLTELIDLFKAREAAGLVKYGTTVDRDDLSLADWLQHALEESMDKTVYLMRALKKLRASQPAEQPRREYPECSGDASSCPENEGYGCCGAKPKPEQAVGDGVVAYVPVHPRTGPLWMDTYGADTKPDRARYPAMPLYGAPRPAVATPAEVMDLHRLLEGFTVTVERNPLVSPATYLDEVRLSCEFQPGQGRVRADALRTALTAQCQVRKDGQGPAELRKVAEWHRVQAEIAVQDKYPRKAQRHRKMASTIEAALASPSAGAVVPDRITAYEAKKRGWLKGPKSYAAGWNACLDALAAAPEVPGHG